MKIWDKNICLTLKLSIKREREEPWRPSEEDIAYQDSMYSIIEQTQLDIEGIKLDINGIIYKLDRLYYEDGSWDSIRYVEGGRIDKSLNKSRQ